MLIENNEKGHADNFAMVHTAGIMRGLTGGNIFHGVMTLDRLGPLRPVPGWARYATPLPGLFLCGAGTHPGGGVMGACGRNAAGVIARALRAER